MKRKETEGDWKEDGKRSQDDDLFQLSISSATRAPVLCSRPVGINAITVLCTHSHAVRKIVCYRWSPTLNPRHLKIVQSDLRVVSKIMSFFCFKARSSVGKRSDGEQAAHVLACAPPPPTSCSNCTGLVCWGGSVASFHGALKCINDVLVWNILPVDKNNAYLSLW